MCLYGKYKIKSNYCLVIIDPNLINYRTRSSTVVQWLFINGSNVGTLVNLRLILNYFRVFDKSEGMNDINTRIEY